jgi:phospholipase C
MGIGGCYGAAAGFALGALGVAPALGEPSVPIKHVILIVQENRSFDQYFGTYPGANGPPRNACVPINPAVPAQGCVAPYHDVHDVQIAGPHSSASAQADLDDGLTSAHLDGFVQQQLAAQAANCAGNPHGLRCTGSSDGVNRHDVMGTHTDAEIPNYWAYAQHFVLQDNFFEGVRSWSLPSHLDITSEWSAVCTNHEDASSCATNPMPPQPTGKPHDEYPWASLFLLLDAHHVSWKYYLGTGNAPDCDDGAMTCPPQLQTAGVESIWNPMPRFNTERRHGQNFVNDHNPPIEQFFADIAHNNLPQVSWIVPADAYSEHPPNGVTAGMEYVTALVNAVMGSAYWNDTAIFVMWDDWGGFYDHVVPPLVDTNATVTPAEGYGLRVPGLLVSAWARPGYVDHSLLSSASFATLFEDLFAKSARLVPAELGIPDSRPTIRDALTRAKLLDGNQARIGALIDEFDFRQTPLQPLILSTHIPTGIKIACREFANDHTASCLHPRVNISWNAVTGAQVPGPFTYHILRDSTELAQCAGTATSCVDDAPPAGTHYYRAYSVNAANVASPASAAAEADVK